MSQLAEVTAADVEAVKALADMTEAEFMNFTLSRIRKRRIVFRLTPAQMREIEDERIGTDTIAPYISF